MEQGTIVKWIKKEGDDIDPGDAVADIQTDKAVMAMEMDDEAVLAKIIVILLFLLNEKIFFFEDLYVSSFPKIKVHHVPYSRFISGS